MLYSEQYRISANQVSDHNIQCFDDARIFIIKEWRRLVDSQAPRNLHFDFSVTPGG
jgi:hypothetical protein